MTDNKKATEKFIKEDAYDKYLTYSEKNVLEMLFIYTMALIALIGTIAGGAVIAKTPRIDLCMAETMNAVALGIWIYAIQKFDWKLNPIPKHTVNKMLRLGDGIKSENKITPEMAKDLKHVTPRVVADMTRDNRQYFDALVNSDVTVRRNKNIQPAIQTIIRAHLEESAKGNTYKADVNQTLAQFDKQVIPYDIIFVNNVKNNKTR